MTKDLYRMIAVCLEIRMPAISDQANEDAVAMLTSPTYEKQARAILLITQLVCNIEKEVLQNLQGNYQGN